jgi:hypothetical protein
MNVIFMVSMTVRLTRKCAISLFAFSSSFQRKFFGEYKSGNEQLCCNILCCKLPVGTEKTVVYLRQDTWSWGHD